MKPDREHDLVLGEQYAIAVPMHSWIKQLHPIPVYSIKALVDFSSQKINVIPVYSSSPKEKPVKYDSIHLFTHIRS